jgi:Family of unknown function (DUF6884)
MLCPIPSGKRLEGNVGLVIACGSQKIWAKQPEVGAIAAREAYTGAMFRGFRRYAERFYPQDWFIVSAKYGLITPDTTIDNYNVTFAIKSTTLISLESLRDQCQKSLPEYRLLISLAGKAYNQRLVEALPPGLRLESPLASLNMFERMKWVGREMRRTKG